MIKTLRLDTVAGLTAAAVVLPKAMAYASVAGLPVEVGLYTAFLPMIIYALMGTSRVLSVSSTTTIAILTAAQLGAVVPGGDPAQLATAAATLALMVGVMLVLASVLRLGFVASFISTPVLTGFKAGIGLVIVLDQAPKLLGLHIDKAGFFRDLGSLVRHLPETSLLTLLVAVATLLILAGLKLFFKKLPAPLIAIATAIGASWWFVLQDHGVSTVGFIPVGLPGLVIPDWSLIMALLPGSLGIALMSYTETIAAGRAFAAQGDPRIQPNRELLATGLANAGGAFFGAMPAGGGTSQTAVVRAVGGRTQAASLVTAAAAVATMLLLAPFLGLMPHATLAAVVIFYSVGLISAAEFAAIRKVRSMEFRWAVFACLGVLIWGTLQGIVVAIVISLMALAGQAIHPHVSVIGRKRGTDILRPVTGLADDETFDGLLIIRPEGRIFFINAQETSERIKQLVEQHGPRVVLLDMSRVFDIEYSAIQMLVEREKAGESEDFALWFAGFNPDVLTVVRRSGLAVQLGDERLFPNSREAIKHFQTLAPGEA
jgi:SulP family sulfate permease